MIWGVENEYTLDIFFHRFILKDALSERLDSRNLIHGQYCRVFYRERRQIDKSRQRTQACDSLRTMVELCN